MNLHPKLSRTSKVALWELFLLIFGYLLGFFVHTIGFNKRPQLGGPIHLYPINQTALVAGSITPSRKWLTGYNTFFGQMESLKGDNAWGVVLLSPKTTLSAALSDSSVPHDLPMNFYDGSNTYPIVIPPPANSIDPILRSA
jgi:hypothetical protein